MGTHCQMAVRSGSIERQYLGGGFNSFWAKKGGSQLQTKNIIGAVAYKLCLYSPPVFLNAWHSLY